MKKSASSESKSLKTFFVYAGIVIFFIFLSLFVKTFFIIRASKFDGRHQFVVNLSKNEKVKEVIVFTPAKHEISVLQVKGEDISVTSANRMLGFIPDGTIAVNDTLEINSDTSKTLRTILFHYASVKTNLTLFDTIRLAILSHQTLNQQQKELHVDNNTVIDRDDTKDLFIDSAISSEDVTIQIVNATGESGIGKRLENILSGLGCNVISVTTSQKHEKYSKIEFFGNESYTLAKIKNILKFSAAATEEKQIADIIIIIGEDSSKMSQF